MTALVLRRLAQLPIIMLVVYTITLLLAWQLPGSPVAAPEGRRPPPEVIAQIERQYNLNSFPTFYLSYLNNATGLRWLTDTLSGTTARARQAAEDAGLPYEPRPVFDLGPSLQYNDWTVNEIVASALPVSVTLGAGAIVIALVLGVAAGVVGAVKPNSLADLATLSGVLVGVSLPSFVTGTAILLVFGVWLALVPVGEWGTLRALAAPALALSLPFAAYIARLTRLGMIEALSADYVRTARAKGCREQRVLIKHALKNAMLPVLSYLGPATAYAMTGSFVVERVFAVPGIGQFFVDAVLNDDRFLLIGVVLVFSGLLVLLNLAVDLLYRWIDPRIEQ